MRAIRHEAGSQKSMPQQVGDPLAILDVGFAAWHLLDMACVHQQQGERPFEHVPCWFPVHTRALERHMRDMLECEPIGELQQIRGHRIEGADLFVRLLARSRHNHASHHGLFVNVESATVLVDYLHLIPAPHV
jgi:hypothetical protein